MKDPLASFDHIEKSLRDEFVYFPRIADGRIFCLNQEFILSIYVPVVLGTECFDLKSRVDGPPWRVGAPVTLLINLS